MSINAKPFGQTPQGEKATLYTLTNQNGASVSITDFGGTVVSIMVPDKFGQLADVTWGFDEVSRYLGKSGSMGALIGRYGNRIAKGRFTLDGQTYQLATNNGENHLHGGNVGYNHKMWQAQALGGKGEDKLILTLQSPDGDENYPGHLSIEVTYTFDDMCNLAIHYRAVTDKATLVNLTNHAYFNLAGHDAPTIQDHLLQVEADVITPVDGGLIPTGDMMPVAGTPFDLREEKLLAQGLLKTAGCPQLALAVGYDHNFVLRKGCQLGLAARLRHPGSGRVMEVITDQPGVQVYTANTSDFTGKGGAAYGQYGAICLETQHYPDSPNQPYFPSTVLRPGESYDTVTIYAFRVA